MQGEEKGIFEMFRGELKSIDVLTFDELFDKIYSLLSLLKIKAVG